VTRVDVLVVLATLALLAAVLAPARANTSRGGETILCLSHLKKLTSAWQLFMAEHAGKLPGNLDGGNAQNWSNSNQTWAVGWLDNTTFRPDNTNWFILMRSQLGAYAESKDIYRCPADKSVSGGATVRSRARSWAMNAYLGPRSGPYTSGYRQFTHGEDFVAMPPAKAFVFIGEREESINDGWFAVTMGGFDPVNPGVYRIVDYPAMRHAGGAGLSFADGHAEQWQWEDSRTMPATQPGRPLPLNVASPNNRDIARLQAASSRKIVNPTR